MWTWIPHIEHWVVLSQLTAQEHNTTFNHGISGCTFRQNLETCKDIGGLVGISGLFICLLATLFIQAEQQQKTFHVVSLTIGSSEQRIPLMKRGCWCRCTQSLMFKTRQIWRVLSEVQHNLNQLGYDENVAQRQCMHEEDLGICTVKIHSMWTPTPFPFVNKIACIYEKRDTKLHVCSKIQQLNKRCWNSHEICTKDSW